MLALSDLQPGDLFANRPVDWLTRYLVQLEGAKTFHWGMFVSPPEFIITESIQKGTAITRYNYPFSYIYRIKDLQNVSVDDILNAIADYGRSTYNMGENFVTGFNYAVNYWLPQYPWEGPPVPSWLPGWPGSPVVDKGFTKPLNASVNCIQYITLIAQRLGYNILPMWQLVIQKTLENSPYLEYLGEFQKSALPV